jgi:hypothetical protein
MLADKMKEIEVTQSGIAEVCLEAFQSFPVVMVQFPEVFGLMAIPNAEGVMGLNRVKSRLPEKYYGSVIGDATRFFRMGNSAGNQDYIPSAEAYKKLEGAIIRIRIGEEGQSTSASRNGTHQGLILQVGPIRNFFREIELKLAPFADSALFLGHNYSAPLCTSANESGHPDGSITDLETARLFGKERGIPLLIRSSQPGTGQMGSFPVLALEKSKIVVERNGPGLEEIISRFESGLFSFRNGQ